MLTDIVRIAATDEHLSALLRNVKECADIYVIVVKRRKGCDGMGEFAMIREEFREAVDGMIRYCTGKGLLSAGLEYDLDRMADQLSASPGQQKA